MTKGERTERATKARIQKAGASLAIKRDAYHRAVNGLHQAASDLQAAEKEWQAACQGGKLASVGGSELGCDEGSEDGN